MILTQDKQDVFICSMCDNPLCEGTCPYGPYYRESRSESVANLTMAPNYKPVNRGQFLYGSTVLGVKPN